MKKEDVTHNTIPYEQIVERLRNKKAEKQFKQWLKKQWMDELIIQYKQ